MMKMKEWQKKPNYELSMKDLKLRGKPRKSKKERPGKRLNERLHLKLKKLEEKRKRRQGRKPKRKDLRTRLPPSAKLLKTKLDAKLRKETRQKRKKKDLGRNSY